MINEITWHKDTHLQSNFVWRAVDSGIEFHHPDSSYVILWETLFAVYAQARSIASKNGGVVPVGVSMKHPAPGLVGAWVLTQDLPIEPGSLTPRHLSFLGPVLCRMGFVDRKIHGDAIEWVIN